MESQAYVSEVKIYYKSINISAINIRTNIFDVFLLFLWAKIVFSRRHHTLLCYQNFLLGNTQSARVQKMFANYLDIYFRVEKTRKIGF